MKAYFFIGLLLLVCTQTLTGCAVNPATDNRGSTLDRELQTTPMAKHGIDETTWPERARPVLYNALSLSGIRYKYGGSSPESGFDCSGFVRYVYQQAANLSLPHSASAISQIGKSIPKQELQPGDLVFFNTLKSAFSHVGIYLGNDRFIHAPSSGGKVRVEDMQERYWKSRFNGAQRIEMKAEN